MEERTRRGRQGGASNAAYSRSILKAGQAQSRPGTLASKSEQGPFRIMLVELEEGTTDARGMRGVADFQKGQYFF